MKKWLYLILLALALGTIPSALAQGVEEYTGTIDDDEEIVAFDLGEVQAGDIVYAFVEATNGTLDTYLLLGDPSGDTIYAENDDVYRGNFNSALVYRVQEAGEYTLYVTRYDESTSGDFRLVLGINTPDVFPTGETQLVQESSGTVTDEEEYVFFDLSDIQAGDTIYVYVEADDSRLDTYVYLGDYNFDVIYAENDDVYPGNTNSALLYTVEESGDYSIAVTRFDESSAGDFRILIGVNTPEVLSGSAESTGDNIAIIGDLPELITAGPRPQVQQFRGEITAADPILYYDLFDMQAGDTLYVYAETLDGDLDTYIGLGDINVEEIFAENDDIDYPDNLNSAFEYTFTADGDYSIAITAAVEGTEGTFRLLIGLNAPDVLTGEAAPTDDLIATPYEGGGVDTGQATDCSEQANRPVPSGDELTQETENFVIHYTLDGADGTNEDFIADVMLVMEEVWDYQIETMGWPAPPTDCGEGGDARFDVYLLEIEGQGILGYAQPDGLVGDNPSSDGVEEYAAYGHLVLDNDYSIAADSAGLMRATAAHEFNHIIQFGYDLNDAARWFYEATATWLETQNYPEDQDAVGYVSSLFESPGLCLGNTGNDPDGLRVYGEWIVIDSLARDFGPEAIPQLWGSIAAFEGMDALYEFAAAVGTTPQEIVIRYGVRALLLDYELSDLFDAEVDIEARINDTGRTITRGTGVQELGLNYLEIELRGVHTYAVDADNLALYLVGISGDEAVLFELGQGGTVDTGDFDHAYLIVLNTDQHSDTDDCTATEWVITVSDGSRGDALDPLNETWDARRFIVP